MKENIESRRFRSLFWLCCFQLLLQNSSLVKSDAISASFTSTFQLNHLAVNNLTGVLYVGAVNRLFQIGEELDLNSKIEYETGPKLDDARCFCDYDFTANKCSISVGTKVDMVITDNQNQVLAIDFQHNQLIVCGTVYHGACTIQNLTNISIQLSAENCIGSNDPNYPMIGIVARGPTGDNVLYAASASTDKSIDTYPLTKCKSGVCILSVSRSNPLSEILSVFDPSISLSLLSKYGPGFKIVYVTSFDINGYTYFLTRQPIVGSSSSASISKIVQICQQDRWYNSYVETEIICNRSGNLVQAGIFSHPGSLWANKLGIDKDSYVMFGIFSTLSSFSICYYPLKVIREKFTENFQRCYNGSGEDADFYLSESPQKCTQGYTVDQISESFCGLSCQACRPLYGTIPLVGTQLNLNLTGVKLTTIQSTAVNNHTVIFLGTDVGQLLKSVITEDGLRQYDSVSLNSNGTSRADMSVNQDMILSRDMTHMYMMTKYKLYKVRLFECEKFQSCAECLSSWDPYCGWCALDARCSSRKECSNSDLPGRWVFPTVLGSASSCPVLLSVTPAQADVNATTSVSSSFTNLPPPKSDEYYTCFFGTKTASSRATYSTNQLNCQIPKITGISVVGNQSINLSFGISSSNASFMSVSFMIYNCSSFNGCLSCTGAPWNCHWCIGSNVCQHQGIDCNNKVNAGSPDSCPRIFPDGEEILISSGTQKDLVISVANLPSLTTAGAANFKCIINFEVQKLSLPASVLDNTRVTCGSYQYLSTKKQPTPVPLRIVWGNNEYPVEGTVWITVFNCSSMAEGDCSICLSLSTGNYSKFNCSWCNGACRPSSNCQTPEQTCPDFTITNIFPNRVPKDGSSLVTINGTNLGSVFSQVKVKVNGILSLGIQDKYMASRQYVFVMNNVTTGSVSIMVSVNNTLGNETSLIKSITATDPKLSAITPTSGPEAGGTLVTITGNDLRSGSNIIVEFGGTSCIYDDRSNDTHILCLTTQANRQTLENKTTTVIPQSSAQTSGQTVVKFDSAVRTLDQSFEFTADPTINPKIAPDGSFESGGCRITVTGTNLDKSLSCTVTAAYKNVTILYRNSSNLIFISPMIGKNYLTSILASTASFQLDAVNLTTNFRVYPDPYLFPLNSSNDAFTAGSTLYLKGLRLNTSCMVQEIEIKIGSKICQITDHTPEALYCIVPSLSSDDVPEVIVRAGQNLEFRLGQLRLQAAQIPWAIAVGVIGGISLVIIVLVVSIFIIKRVKNKRELDQLKQQLEQLERSVREQCRLAFTELHTEVSDFNSDLEEHGIPFWDFKTYAFRLLFPRVHNHPVLTVNRNSKNKFGGFDEQMQQFNQLLSSQVFILTFIDVLDKQLKVFSVNDRVKVASLLGVILLNRMEFATDVIKELLGDLIKRYVDKKTPRLMLRSTDSLVEKLLANWLSLSMFEYLRDSAAGDALFMLYKALKHQMEKGPIDAVTAEARNTLSEDRLLRDNIEPTVLNLTIFEDNKSVTCKMLSSDSISQAKEKALDALYKNIPYSKRPSSYDINLAWKTGTETVLHLSDEDSSSVVADGWKRINTLEHYRIPDESCFILSRRSNNEEDSMETVTEYMSQHFGHALKSENESTSIWHLVKHEEGQNSKSPKVISEIFLTRLLSTKMIINKYIKDLFEAIFQVDSSLPPIIKYLYDFLDKAAQKHGIVDDDVVHAWKSNSLLLRFWVNVITNPAFVFDISKSNVVSSCLSVVAQAFIDSCSTQELYFGRDSPSTKLLFAKDIPGYQKLVQQFFSGIRNLPPVSDEDMEAEMVALSKRNKTDFNLEMALRDLYSYADKFQYELMVALSNNISARRMHLLEKFQDIQKVTHPE